jgi:RND family efflux transporter MFP subunit
MNRYALLLALLGSLSCHSHGHSDAHSNEHGSGTNEERPTLSFTHWTEAEELFIELPALVRGMQSPCAAHVTKLDGFSPLAAGRVTVILSGTAGEERFEASIATSPGIFRPVVKAKTSGKRNLAVEIRSPEGSARHDLGEITVYDTVAGARTTAPAGPDSAGRIAFLKEQQWPIDFGTAVATERPIRSHLRATGIIRPRTDGELVVSAPVAGRVATSGRSLPQLGTRVTIGDTLGLLAPRLEAADLASLELAVTSADLELRYAQRELQRLENLRSEGAVPERRVQDAVHAVEEAKASQSAAKRRLDQFRLGQRTTGRGEGSVQLRAPLSGTITEVRVAPGAFVESGAVLFRITDLTQLWLEARVAEIDIGQLGMPRGASFRVEGQSDFVELSAESFVARGHVVDPDTRTLPLLFAVDNASGQLAPGAFARVLVVNGHEKTTLAVPESALVDDRGVFVVYVQQAGEAFERRIVRVGARDRGYVEVASGLRTGERVVTRGAWSVKLAASSGSIPAHGHAH